MSEWVVPIVVALVGGLIPILAGIRSRNPAKRGYWEREVQERFGPDKEWPAEGWLRKRAEIALAYVDADEAIRRTGVPGAAASWAAGGLSYAFGAFSFYRAQQLATERADAAELADVASPVPWFVVAVVVLAGGVFAFADATTTPQRRQQLQRVLVGVIALPGGAEAMVEKPESFVNAWTHRKTRNELKKNTKDVKDAGRLYEAWAKALLEHYNNPGTKTLRERKGKGQ
ncbi:hypothetical protein [Brevibacterium yomogidense]|uniref:hypothetical protein n=1 Tax=Brevibacterium yomogidense TaxID=946573 RepID=UPI000B34D27C|nr:hypothetical protein [Brevibacterium yomogidense]